MSKKKKNASNSHKRNAVLNYPCINYRRALPPVAMTPLDVATLWNGKTEKIIAPQKMSRKHISVGATGGELVMFLWVAAKQYDVWLQSSLICGHIGAGEH